MSGPKHVHRPQTIGDIAEWCFECGALRVRVASGNWGHWRRPGARARRSRSAARRQLDMWAPARLPEPEPIADTPESVAEKCDQARRIADMFGTL